MFALKVKFLYTVVVLLFEEEYLLPYNVITLIAVYRPIQTIHTNVKLTASALHKNRVRKGP